MSQDLLRQEDAATTEPVRVRGADGVPDQLTVTDAVAAELRKSRDEHGLVNVISGNSEATYAVPPLAADKVRRKRR